MATDLSSIMSTLLSGDTLKGISKTSGIDANAIKDVLSDALPSLLSGVSSQSTGKNTAESFAQALANHSKNDTSNLANFFSKVDVADGAKIVQHLLGNKTSSTANSTAKKTGLSADNVSQILSTAAPLLMSLVGQHTYNQKKENNTIDVASVVGNLLGGKTDLSDLLGSFLKK